MVNWYFSCARIMSNSHNWVKVQKLKPFIIGLGWDTS